MDPHGQPRWCWYGQTAPWRSRVIGRCATAALLAMTAVLGLAAPAQALAIKCPLTVDQIHYSDHVPGSLNFEAHYKCSVARSVVVMDFYMFRCEEDPGSAPEAVWPTYGCVQVATKVSGETNPTIGVEYRDNLGFGPPLAYGTYVGCTILTEQTSSDLVTQTKRTPNTITILPLP